MYPLRPVRPAIETSLFDMFEAGPGPSSSHTIGPMKAGFDFLALCNALAPQVLQRAARMEVRLFGSLSATGFGHGTDAAVCAGLLGHQPSACPAGLLGNLLTMPHDERVVRFATPTASPVIVGCDSVIHDEVQHAFPYSNTMLVQLVDAQDKVLLEREYYSVGGGFIQWKGWEPEKRGTPAHPYGTMSQLRERLKDTGLALHELMLENEMALTGMGRAAILDRLESIITLMEDSVTRGLDALGPLPGTLGVFRKARTLRERSGRLPTAVDAFLCRLNAYAFAASEENASGGVIVTAPTCGAAGVMPAVLYAMRHDLAIGDRAIREGVLASAAVGFLAKHNAGIAGAEVGCQGEVGVASAMAAAMLAHARGNAVHVVENAAEIALEHHLGLTCDPVGGYVQIPCIERNAVGAVKAYNACLVACCEDPKHHRVSLDSVISAMAEIGHDMNAKFKETSAGGLAVSMVEC